MTVFDDFLAASLPAGAFGLMWLRQATVALRVEGVVVPAHARLYVHVPRTTEPPA